MLSIKRNDFVVDIIGDGSDKKNLENKAIEMGLGNQVIFHGFKQKEELPAFFAQTDCFLFQTGFDIWGLVLNEAMAAGLPCIVSPNAGAVDDLIKDGENGYICKFTEPDKVITLINDLLDDTDKAHRISLAASSFIQSNASIPKSTEGFLKAIHYCKV